MPTLPDRGMMLSRLVWLSAETSPVASLSRRTWAALGVVFALVWFANLDVRALQHPDEGRYAEIAREMLATGDWVMPRLDGIRYFEKPPLQYWLTAASFKAFDVDEWTARLPCAIAGFLTVLFVAYVGAIVASPAAGIYAGVTLAGSLWLFGISHLVTLDALLTFWLTLSLGAFLLAQHVRASPASARRWILLAWAAAAGGVLTKGLIALLIPFCALIIHTLVTRDLAPWKRLHPRSGLLVLLVLAAPWFVLVSLRAPEFARFFFIHEHFERFLTTEHRRTGQWWYFVPMFVVGFLPWTGFFLWRLRRAWLAPYRDAGGFAWAKFCLVWAAFVFVFFSASGSKLPSYILPMFPAAALVLGAELEAMRPEVIGRLTGVLLGCTLAIWLAMLLGWSQVVRMLAGPDNPAALYEALGPWIKLAFGVSTVGYLVGLVAFRRGGERGKSVGIVALSLATILGLQAAFTGSDAFRATRSAADLVTTLENDANPPYDPSAPFFQVRMYDQTLPFYLGRTTTPVEYRDELGPGLDAQPELGIARLSDWIERWQRLPQGYALMSPDTRVALVASGVPMHVVAADSRRVLVARH